MELNNHIHSGAVKEGICSDWATYIKEAKSKEELMEMYVKGIDFCLEHNFPSNSDLLKFGGSSFLSNYGVYVDAQVNEIDQPFIVLLGTCKAKIAYNNYTAGQLFNKANSDMKVVINDNAFIVIDCFDESRTHIQANGNSKVCINIYGNAKVTYKTTGAGIVKIVKKNKPTY